MNTKGEIMAYKIIVALYGLFLLAGAYFGWKAGSKVSLIMGIVSGLLILAGVYYTGLNLKGGFLYLSVLSGLLAVVFLVRFLKTYTLMPAGLLLAVSAIVCMMCFMQFKKIH